MTFIITISDEILIFITNNFECYFYHYYNWNAKAIVRQLVVHHFLCATVVNLNWFDCIGSEKCTIFSRSHFNHLVDSISIWKMWKCKMSHMFSRSLLTDIRLQKTHVNFVLIVFSQCFFFSFWFHFHFCFLWFGSHVSLFYVPEAPTRNRQLFNRAFKFGVDFENVLSGLKSSYFSVYFIFR